MSSVNFEASFDALLASELNAVIERLLDNHWQQRLLGHCPSKTAELVHNKQLALTDLIRFRRAAIKAFQQRTTWLPYLSDIQLLKSIGFTELDQQIEQMIMLTAIRQAQLPRYC